MPCSAPFRVYGRLSWFKNNFAWVYPLYALAPTAKLCFLSLSLKINERKVNSRLITPSFMFLLLKIRTKRLDKGDNELSRTSAYEKKKTNSDRTMCPRKF